MKGVYLEKGMRPPPALTNWAGPVFLVFIWTPLLLVMWRTDRDKQKTPALVRTGLTANAIWGVRPT
jgi:hypothetical protein